MKKAVLFALTFLCCTYWGVAQNGLDFDGTDDVVQTTYMGVLGSQDRTFEAWVFVSSSAPASNLAILDYGQNLAGSRNTFLVSGTRELRFISGGTNANIQAPVNSVPVNQWVHVAFVLDNGTGYLYVNGNQVGTGSLSSVNTPSAQNIKLGERVLGGSIPFQGAIDELRVWDVARSATEIQANMNAEFCGPQANLQLYLKLNEGTAGMNNTTITTTADHSGNNYTGTLSNFSLSGATSNWVNGASIGAGVATSSVQQRACKQFLWPVDSILYTSSGTFTDTLAGATAQGCDSVITLNLTIDTVNTSVTQNGVVLTANATGASYQWVTCPAFTPITGDTNQSFTATANGDYAVIITDSVCSDTSACLTVASVSTEEYILKQSLQVLPNPTPGNFTIDLGMPYSTATLTLLDLTGRCMQSQTFRGEQQPNLQLVAPAGVYILVVETESQRATIRVVKE